MNSSLSSQSSFSRFSLAAVGSLVSKVMMAVGIVVLMSEGLLAACGCVFAYGWLFRGPLSFHPDWTQEERAVLENLGTEMRDASSPMRVFGVSRIFRRGNLALRLKDVEEIDWVSGLEEICTRAVRGKGDAEDDEEEEDEEDVGMVGLPWLLKTFFDDVRTAQQASLLDRQLRQVTSTGDARGAGALAVAVAASGNEKAVKLLLLHGAEPEYQDADGHDVLSAWIGTCRAPSAVRGERFLPEEKGRCLEVAEWLLQHGAAVRDEWGLYSYACLHPAAEAEPMLEWLMDRGLSMKAYWNGGCWELPLNDLVAWSVGNLSLVRFCLRKGWADLNDTSGSSTPLQRAVQWCSGEKEEAAVLHELLELGADPNLLPNPRPEPGEAGEALLHVFREEESPLRMVLSSLEEADASGRAVLLEMADDLLRHGAKPEKCAIPDSPEWEKALEQLYHRYGHEVEWETVPR